VEPNSATSSNATGAACNANGQAKLNNNNKGMAVVDSLP